MRQQIQAARENGMNPTLITCSSDPEQKSPGIRNFTPKGMYGLPEHPELKISCPPFLEMLRFCHDENFTHIHSATPGPIGLAATAIASILNLPFSGTYHKAFPQYAEYLTRDSYIHDLTWKYILWYYNRMDRIYVSSESSGAELTGRGINPEKIRLIPLGADMERFDTFKENPPMAKAG